MHIEKRVEGKKAKYFLAHSYREGAKVYKFRKYLGQDLKVELLEERREIAEKLILEEIHKYNIIKDPLQTKLSEKEIEEIKKLEAQIPLKISHLSKEDWQTFSRIFTYNTNAIEGSKLNVKEVKELLEKDKWPDKSKEDSLSKNIQLIKVWIYFFINLPRLLIKRFQKYNKNRRRLNKRNNYLKNLSINFSFLFRQNLVRFHNQ